MIRNRVLESARTPIRIYIGRVISNGTVGWWWFTTRLRYFIVQVRQRSATGGGLLREDVIAGSPVSEIGASAAFKTLLEFVEIGCLWFETLLVVLVSDYSVDVLTQRMVQLLDFFRNECFNLWFREVGKSIL